MNLYTLRQIFVKFSLYLAVTAGAMSLAYLFGFYPYIKAQNTQSTQAQPALDNTQAGSGTATSAINPDPVSDAATALEINKKQNDSGQSIQVGSDEYVPKINPYKFTDSYIGDITSDEKDPFRKPKNILDLEEEIKRPKRMQDNQIDEKMEAIRRWPLQQYRLIAIIWDVSNPKAMIEDPDKKKHLLKRNYRMGDQDGLITKISEGSITVLQGNVPVVVSLFKEDN